MEELLYELVSNFDTNPSVKGRSLRELADQDWDHFTTASLAALTEDSSSHGARYLVALLLRGGTLAQAICDAALFNIMQAAAITRLASSVDTQFDIELARRLTSSAGIEEHEAERILKILEEASGGGRLQPFLAQLLTHPNRRIRSKAALLIGRSNRNAEWASEQQSNEDARIRANAVEALWGNDDPACRAFFLEAALDPNPRVAGNAVIGLYKTHDTIAIRKLYEMANHPDLPWQVTAAWAMGESGNPHFQASLTRLMNAGDPKLRQHAIRALSRIRQFSRTSQGADSLSVSACLNESGMNTKILALVTTSENNHIPNLLPTEFLLLEGETPVVDYSVVEHSGPPVLAIGFALPQKESAADSAIVACLAQKRPADQWCVQKYATEQKSKLHSYNGHGILGLEEPILESDPAKIQFTSEPGLVTESVSDSKLQATCSEGLAAAARDLIDAVLPIAASRQMICISNSNSIVISTEEEKAVTARIRAARITVHGISISECDPFLENLCRDSGGSFHRISKMDEILATLQKVHLSLLSRYEIEFLPSNPEASQLTLRVYSKSGYGESTIELPANC